MRATERPWPGLLIAAALAAALLLVVAAVLGGVRGLERGAARPPGPEGRDVTARGSLSELELGSIAVFESAAPGVVHISSSSESLRWYESLDRVRDWVEGEASGFVWDAQNHVVTNQHVVSGARTLIVTTADGSRYRAEVVGTSDALDLAVLRVDAPAGVLRPLPLGSSAGLRVGQLAYAIGSPLGLDHTLTAGLVSGLERTVRDDRGRLLTGLIQTDASIHPGSSGGPLLDSAARVIGVATAVVDSLEGTGGIGFAVPIDVVNRAVPRLMSDEGMGQAAIGLLVGRSELLDALGLEEGLPVGAVLPDSPAARAGLRGVALAPDGGVTADVLLRVGDQPVASSADLVMALAEHAPGDELELEIWRDGERFTVELKAVAAETLGSR